MSVELWELFENLKFFLKNEEKYKKIYKYYEFVFEDYSYRSLLQILTRVADSPRFLVCTTVLHAGREALQPNTDSEDGFSREGLVVRIACIQGSSGEKAREAEEGCEIPYDYLSYMYHGTDQKGYEGIVSSGEIRVGGNNRDAFRRNHIYLTCNSPWDEFYATSNDLRLAGLVFLHRAYKFIKDYCLVLDAKRIARELGLQFRQTAAWAILTNANIPLEP